MEQIVRQWLERVIYDMDTARALLKARKYLYASFMCQQAVEKALKAVLANQCKEVPPIHNLKKLAMLAEIEDEMDAQQVEFLEQLTPFAIKARYGSYKKKLSEICDRKTAVQFLSMTEKFIPWLKKKM